jgi:hypothetical protein
MVEEGGDPADLVARIGEPETRADRERLERLRLGPER